MREQLGDDVLYALSALLRVSWARFAQIFDELLRESSLAAAARDQGLRFLRWQTADLLESLGHTDVVRDNGNSELFAAVPTLGLLPVPGLARAVLSGSRSPRSLAELRAVATRRGLRVSEVASSVLVPTTVTVEADLPGEIRDLAAEFGVRFSDVPPGPAIAHMSISLAEYLAELRWEPQFTLNWPSARFDPSTMQFGADPNDSRTRLVRFQDPVKNGFRYRLFDGDRSAWADARWGRYAVLASLTQASITYDEADRSVHVPLRAPLPKLLSRALTLCSGLVPDRVGDKVIRFSRVPRGVYSTVSAKLSMSRAPS